LPEAELPAHASVKRCFLVLKLLCGRTLLFSPGETMIAMRGPSNAGANVAVEVQRIPAGISRPLRDDVAGERHIKKS
jgi:hypothetical protein